MIQSFELEKKLQRPQRITQQPDQTSLNPFYSVKY